MAETIEATLKNLEDQLKVETNERKRLEQTIAQNGLKSAQMVTEIKEEVQRQSMLATDAFHKVVQSAGHLIDLRNQLLLYPQHLVDVTESKKSLETSSSWRSPGPSSS